MSRSFKYTPKKNRLSIVAAQTTQMTCLMNNGNNGKVKPVSTTVWGYGQEDDIGVIWPGRTIERHVNDEPLEIRWQNKITSQKENCYHIYYLLILACTGLIRYTVTNITVLKRTVYHWKHMSMVVEMIARLTVILSTFFSR